MKRFFRALAWAGMLALIAGFPLWAASLSAERVNPVQEKYSTWTGVLRVWRCEGWQSGSGSLTNWLNACIEAFEKKHPGVYVQLIDVSEESMRAFSEDMSNPPDLLIYAPGMLNTPQGLSEMTGEYRLLNALQEMGKWEGKRYAVSVALGGYALAINSQLLPVTPNDWREVQLVRKNPTQKASKAEIFDMPSDTGVHSWSAAVIALFAGNAAEINGHDVPIGEGIDLGLGDDVRAAETLAPHREYHPNALPESLPENFGTRKSVYADFSGGYLAAMPATQREIRRLELLADGGKAPEWRAEVIGLPFTDQAALVSVTEGGTEERRQLCIELIDLMLSERMQKKLTSSRAFAAADIAPIYPANRAMSAMEAALKSDGLLVPPAFGDEWRKRAAALMRDIGAGESTQGAYEALKRALSGTEKMS